MQTITSRRFSAALAAIVAATALSCTCAEPCRPACDALARDVAFITRFAPPQDLPLPGECVTNNCILAEAARATAPEMYPDEIHLDYVLPYSVIREERDDWRGEFRERFLPVVHGCSDAYEAAVRLDLGCSLSTAHYAACQWLELKLLRGDFADEREKKGLFWDRDATVFYGDPVHRVYTASAETPPPEAADAPPRLVVFPSASEKRRLAEIHDGWRIFEADDFALIFKPDSKPDR